MGKVGFQDFWVAGARVYLQREASDGSEQPTRDLGVVESATPTMGVQKASLKDADGGRKVLVDETTIELTETFEVVLNNLNLENLATFFLSSDPQAFVQAAASKKILHKAYKGDFLKLRDDDAAKTWLWGIDKIAGVIKGASLGASVVNTGVIQSITNTAGVVTLLVTGDITADVAANDWIIIAPDALANLENARTVQVASRSVSTNTTVTLTAASSSGMITETPAGSAGVLYYKGSGDTGAILVPDVDWKAHQTDRGIVSFPSAGSVLSAGANDVMVVFKTAARDGKFLINPQSLQGEIVGKLALVYGRSGNADQTVREARVQIAPAGTTAGNPDNYNSLTFTVTVLADTTNAVPAGRLLQFKGTRAAL